MSKKQSGLRSRSIIAAPKLPQGRHGWWVNIDQQQLDEAKDLWVERGIHGSEINKLYPSTISLARFLVKELGLNVKTRCVIDFMKDYCHE